MKLAITDGCDGGQHHVEAIEPRPTFHVVEAKHSNEHERDQAEEENLQIEQGFHSSHSGASGREAQCPNIKIRFCGEAMAEVFISYGPMGHQAINSPCRSRSPLEFLLKRP